MRCLAISVVLLLTIPGSGGAAPLALPTPSQGLLCRTAIAAAEQAGNIPPHLLAAIGRVESGRRDPVTGDWHPWPWTVNAEGQGSFYDTKAEAVAAVRAMQSRGVQSIDVGCAQINLMHHPNAFPNLDMAFEPQVNANYAAKFLSELHSQTGDWAKAAAMYHSATPELGDDYQKKVMAMWPEETRLAGGVGMSPLARAWGATLSAGSLGFTQVVPSRAFGLGKAPLVIMQPTTSGTAPAGRGLAAYRAAPVSLAFQPPPRRTGL